MNKALSNNAHVNYFGFPLPISLLLPHGHSPSYLMFVKAQFYRSTRVSSLDQQVTMNKEASLKCASVNWCTMQNRRLFQG